MIVAWFNEYMAAVEKDVSYNEVIVSNMLSLKRTFNPLMIFKGNESKHCVSMKKLFTR